MTAAVDETYLGDGLYASYNGFHFWLRAPRSGGNHEVALESVVLESFLRYVGCHANSKMLPIFSRALLQGLAEQDPMTEGKKFGPDEELKTPTDASGVNRELENYERAYARMWQEISRARDQRDQAFKLIDGARDLIIELAFLNDKGEIHLTGRANEAFVRFMHHFSPEWET